LLPAVLKSLLDEELIKADGSVLTLAGHAATFSKSHKVLAERLLSIIQGAGFRPSPVADMARAIDAPQNEVMKILAILVKQRRLVRLEPELFFHPSVFQSAISKLRHEIAIQGSVTVGNIATVLDSSRKYVVPFLEYTDKIGVTKRQGDQRVVGPRFEEGDVETGSAASK
jgi:selenocysteine-specific elongation factor